MNLEAAQKKAAAKTAAGKPTKVVADASASGGYRTRNVAAAQAAYTTYRKSEKARATTARAKLGYYDGQLRLNSKGERFTEVDLLALRQEQKNQCFVLGVSLDGTKRNGSTVRAVDHCWATGFVRRLLHHDANTIAGLLEKHGITSWSALNIFAHKMAALFLMPFLTMTEEEARKAKRRAKANAKRAA
jgi:hypothetical protein